MSSALRPVDHATPTTNPELAFAASAQAPVIQYTTFLAFETQSVILCDYQIHLRASWTYFPLLRHTDLTNRKQTSHATAHPRYGVVIHAVITQVIFLAIGR